MNIQTPVHGSGRTAAFTMVEIAIAVAVIGFALVAIIGVLPAGLQVQKENRQETLIGQDGAYLMEAIRNGAQGANDLANYVDRIQVGFDNKVYTTFNNGAEVIGLLSTPGTLAVPCTNIAIMRSISGALADKRPEAIDLAFRYQLRVQILPFDPAPTDPNVAAITSVKLNEVRLSFLWPVLPNGSIGNGRQVLRTLISGDFMVRSNGATPYFFLRP